MIFFKKKIKNKIANIYINILFPFTFNILLSSTSLLFNTLFGFGFKSSLFSISSNFFPFKYFPSNIIFPLLSYSFPLIHILYYHFHHILFHSIFYQINIHLQILIFYLYKLFLFFYSHINIHLQILIHH